VANNEDRNERQVVGFLGVGLDNKDGHRRLTSSEHFILIGGSEATHEHMQEAAIKFDESLRRRGKVLHETSLEEILEIFHDAHE
jgi:hypothetical protein